jgi:hypothetical protein
MRNVPVNLGIPAYNGVIARGLFEDREADGALRRNASIFAIHNGNSAFPKFL